MRDEKLNRSDALRRKVIHLMFVMGEVSGTNLLCVVYEHIQINFLPAYILFSQTSYVKT